MGDTVIAETYAHPPEISADNSPTAENSVSAAMCVFDRHMADNPVQVLMVDRCTGEKKANYAHALCAQRLGVELLGEETDDEP